MGCPQRSLVRLADGVLGDGVHYGDRGGTFVAREFARAQRVQHFGIDGAARSWLDEGSDGFTPLVVRYTDDRSFLARWGRW
jgi:hypothetical protein